MKTLKLALAVALFVSGGARAQFIDPIAAPVLEPKASTGLAPLPPARKFNAGSEGLPPADPHAPDLYRPDPKLFAAYDFSPNFAIESRFTNPGYREGLHYQGPGPRLAKGIPLGVDGYDLSLAGRLNVPVNDQLTTFGSLGVVASSRMLRGATTREIAPIASVGASYRINSKQTATVEIPILAASRKLLNGTANGYGGGVKVGF